MKHPQFFPGAPIYFRLFVGRVDHVIGATVLSSTTSDGGTTYVVSYENRTILEDYLYATFAGAINGLAVN